MNSICLSTDPAVSKLPVLGLDVAKKSVQAELRTSGNKVRFGFANSAKGFTQLAHILKQHNVPKVWAGLEATGPYSHALALWLHGQAHRVSLLNPRRVKEYARSAGNRNKTDLLDAAVIADFVCAHTSLQPGTHLCKKWRNCRLWCAVGKKSPSCSRQKRTAWKEESLAKCAAL